MHASLHRHIGLTAVATGVLAVALGAQVRRAHIDGDVANLLPGGPHSPREAARLLQEFGALDTLLLDLEIPGATADELVDEGTKLAQKLRATQRFSEVVEGPSSASMLRLIEVVLPRRLYLFENPGAEIETRLQPDRLAASLAALKAQLAAPQAFGLKRELLGDPLGLNVDLLKRLQGASGGVEPYRGHLLSGDRKHLLLVTLPHQSALDVDAAKNLLELIRRLAAEIPGKAVLVAVGGPRFAAESAETVRRDVLFNSLSSLAALLALFVVRFRSARLFALASVPLAFGVLLGVAVVVAVRGHIHGLTLGFGAALVGIAMDYPTYLLNRASVEPGDGLSRISSGLDDVWRSLWLGFVTTALCFAVLFFSRFPALQELAMFAGIGLCGAFAFTLVLLPPLVSRWGPARGRAPEWTPRLERLRLRKIPAVLLGGLLLGGFAVLARTIGFDGDLRNLDSPRLATLAENQSVLERFGQRSTDSLVAVRGASADEALAGNDAVARALDTARARGWVRSANSLAGFLPSQVEQRARAATLSHLDLSAAAERLAKAAANAGFTAHAFDGFWDEVRSVQAGQVSAVIPTDLAGTAVEPWVARALHCSTTGCLAVTTFELADAGHTEAVGQLLPEGAILVDAGRLAQRTMVEIPRQMLLLCGLGLLSNLVVLALAYRSWRSAVAAVAPCLLALVCTVGILAIAGLRLNIVSGSGLVLVLGCGVDYGIFMLHGIRERQRGGGVDALGVVLTSLTTLLGFGTLAFASHRALQSIGLAVGIGIAVCAVAVVTLMPGLCELLGLSAVPGSERD